MEPKHEKVSVYTPQIDGSVKIDTKSYYDKLSQEVVEVEKHVLTSFHTLKRDVEEALEHVTTDKASQLVLTIKISKGEPKLTKRWVTLKKNYPRQ